MLRNSKTLFDKLTQEQVDTLNSLGFKKYEGGVRSYKNVDIGDNFFIKGYYLCGVQFILEIARKEKVTIRSPYDDSWSAQWELSEFTSEMDDFYASLKEDLTTLKKAKVIS